MNSKSDTAIFAVALTLPPGERAAYLNQACAGEIQLRRRVEAMLQADDQAGACLPDPIAPPGQTARLTVPLTERPGDRIGRYRLLADAIRIVAGFYKASLLPKPKNCAYAFPYLLTFQDAPTVIEQKRFVMFLKNRMPTFQGTFHANPDYALWYGWSEMQRDLTEIKTLAAELRERNK